MPWPMPAILLPAAASCPGICWRDLRWGAASDWVTGGLTALAVFLTYLLLRKETAALRQDRAERRCDFFRYYAVSLRPVLEQARRLCGDVIAHRKVDRAFVLPALTQVQERLGDIRPGALVDTQLDRHVDAVCEALEEMFKRAPVGTRGPEGNVTVEEDMVELMMEMARQGNRALDLALKRLSALEAPPTA